MEESKRTPKSKTVLIVNACVTIVAHVVQVVVGAEAALSLSEKEVTGEIVQTLTGLPHVLGQQQ